MYFRLTVFALMLLGLPLFWLLHLPHYMLFVSLLSFSIVIQSVLSLKKTRHPFWLVQVFFFLIVTIITLFIAL